MAAYTTEQFKEWGARGGRARKKILSPRRRKQIAVKASRAAARKRRKNGNGAA